MGTVDLTNQVAVCLARIYQRGFTVDRNALDEVRLEFEQERKQLTDDLQAHVRRLMGDTPINLNSPEQLSWVIYSRKVNDKQFWATQIDPYMPDDDFRNLVNAHTTKLAKTRATQCKTCNGTGYIRKTKKNGEPFAKPNRCPNCDTAGYLLSPSNAVAGLKFKPPSAKWASANGFSTSKLNLETLEKAARVKGMTEAVDFLSKVRRLSAVDTYLSSFVEGIKMLPSRMASCMSVCYSIARRQVACQVQNLTCRTCHVAAPSLSRRCSCPGGTVARLWRLTLHS